MKNFINFLMLVAFVAVLCLSCSKNREEEGIIPEYEKGFYMDGKLMPIVDTVVRHLTAKPGYQSSFQVVFYFNKESIYPQFNFTLKIDDMNVIKKGDNIITKFPYPDTWITYYKSQPFTNDGSSYEWRPDKPGSVIVKEHDITKQFVSIEIKDLQLHRRDGFDVVTDDYFIVNVNLDLYYQFEYQ